MAPNLCFPLFPVVDYQTFRRQYFDAPSLEIYQNGMRWISRGVIQLVLYRLVYHRFPNDPGTVRDLGDVIQFILATYFLYLRVSGTFHIAIGLLGLFGWRLPETHHLYYLASSFNDYWRRINIYWKDFMMKLVYYPSFFRLRRVGNTVALVGATAAVFLATWVLHSYQWFWLRGGWPISLLDVLFWGILGVLVIWNALRESKRGRKRAVGQRTTWSWSQAWRTLGTFTALCLLWSLWSAESLGGWFVLWSSASVVEPRDLAMLAALLVAGLAIGGYPWGAPALAPSRPRRWYAHPAVATSAPLVLALAVAAAPSLQLAGPRAAGVIASLRKTSLNSHDEAARVKGYYEGLDDPRRAVAASWDPQEPHGWHRSTAEYLVKVDSIPRQRLLPNVSAIQIGKPLHINRWAMRGPDYLPTKPAGTRRLVVLGASQVFGYGVADEEVFTARLQDHLNAAARGGERYEVLNFAVSRSNLLDRLHRLEAEALAFQPDVVLLAVNWREPRWLKEDLVEIMQAEGDLHYPEVRDIMHRYGAMEHSHAVLPVPTIGLRVRLASLGIQTRMPGFEREVRITRATDEIVHWALRRIADRARAAGAVPVMLGLDMVTDVPPDFPEILDWGRHSGYDVIDLFGLFDDQQREAMRLAPWNDHQNARGHELIAERLFRELEQRRERLWLQPAGSMTASR
jgi:hypothetical protein